MTEVRKPGANNKVASVPYVSKIAYFCYPQELKNWPGSAYSFQEASKKN